MSPSSPLLWPESPLSGEDRDIVRALLAAEALAVAAAPERRSGRQLAEAIAAQPDAVRAVLAQAAEIEALGAEIVSMRPRRLYLTGTGDALAVARAVRPLFEEMFGMPAEPIDAMELAYYGRQPFDAETLVISIALDDAAPRTCEAIIVARAMGAPTLAVVLGANTQLSVLAAQTLALAPVHREAPCGSSAALMALNILALGAGRHRRLAAERLATLGAANVLLPAQMQAAIATLPAAARAAAESLSPERPLFVVAAGPSLACADLGARLIRNTTGRPASMCGLEDFHSGGMVPHGDVLLIAPNGLSASRAEQAAGRVRSGGGRVIVVTAEDNEALLDAADVALPLPALIERLSPLVYGIGPQMLAAALCR